MEYRTPVKDIFNKMYADELKKTFSTLPTELQKEFEKFTENLMTDEYISRFKLLDATDAFYKKNFRLCDTSYKWVNFTDNAFNYRPYQPAL